MAANENFFVYKFLDAEQNPIYVGKTTNLKGRIKGSHFSGHGHLPEECYDEAAIVVYSKCVSESDMCLQERYLISTLHPKYNFQFNRGDSFSFTIDCFDWKYLPFVRPEKKAPKKAPPRPEFATILEDFSAPTHAIAAPSLAALGPLYGLRDDPGRLQDLFSFGRGFDALRGLALNGEVWLSALSICEFSFQSNANFEASKIRVTQFIQRGFLTREDVLIVQNTGFQRHDYSLGHFGKYADSIGTCSSGILIRLGALKGFVDGLFERHTREERRRLDSGKNVRALYRSANGDIQKVMCKTFQEFCDLRAGPEGKDANLFGVHRHIERVCAKVSKVGIAGAVEDA